MSEQDYTQLTLFPEDSPVSHSVWLESKKVKGTIVTSGRRCSELSESCARIASSVRTYLESSRLPPGRWSRIWSTLAITSSCSIMKLRLLELGTDEAGFSLWATPNTMDSMDRRSYEAMKRQATNGGRKNRRRPCNLREQVNPLMCQAYIDASTEAKAKLFPTPRANEYKGHAAISTAVEAERTGQVQPDTGNSTGEVIHHAMCSRQPGQHRREQSQELADGRCWAAEPGVGRVVNGLPNRVDRLKCLDNAVVPQQAYPIFKALKEELNRDQH